MAGSSWAPLKLNKQLRIELLYRYKRATTSRITVLNIRKLYLYFVYFKLYVYLSGGRLVPSKNDAPIIKNLKRKVKSVKEC